MDVGQLIFELGFWKDYVAAELWNDLVLMVAEISHMKVMPLAQYISMSASIYIKGYSFASLPVEAESKGWGSAICDEYLLQTPFPIPWKYAP